MSWLAALHITEEIDLTGIATAVLALATAGLAWWTRGAVKQSSTEIERAHRPVLVPKTDSSQSYTPWAVMGGFPLDPAMHDRTLFVPVRNIGMGPALGIRAHVEFGDIEGHPSTSGVDATGQADLAGISHNEAWVVLSFRRVTVEQMIGFVLTLSYEDVAGQMWITTARYSQESQSFPDVKVRPA